jgi:hypothetical protein
MSNKFHRKEYKSSNAGTTWSRFCSIAWDVTTAYGGWLKKNIKGTPVLHETYFTTRQPTKPNHRIVLIKENIVRVIKGFEGCTWNLVKY